MVDNQQKKNPNVSKENQDIENRQRQGQPVMGEQGGKGFQEREQGTQKGELGRETPSEEEE